MEWLSFMPEWAMGASGVVMLPLVIWLWRTMRIRAKVKAAGVSHGKILRRISGGYDIPMIGGKAEETLKERILSTVADYAAGIYQGLTGRDPDAK